MGKQRNISDDAELIRKHLLNEMSAEEQEKLDSIIKECPALCNIINELQQHGTIKEEIEKLRKYSAESPMRNSYVILTKKGISHVSLFRNT